MYNKSILNILLMIILKVGDIIHLQREKNPLQNEYYEITYISDNDDPYVFQII